MIPGPSPAGSRAAVPALAIAALLAAFAGVLWARVERLADGASAPRINAPAGPAAAPGERGAATGPAPTGGTDPRRQRWEAESARLQARAGIARAALHGFRPRVALKMRETVARWQARRWAPVFDRLGAALVAAWTDRLGLAPAQQADLRAALAERAGRLVVAGPADSGPLIDVRALAERLTPGLSPAQKESLQGWLEGR